MATSSSSPARPRVLIIGNSHTKAIAAALDEVEHARFAVVNIATYFDPVNGKNKVLPRSVVELFQPKRIYCTFGGSEHSVFALMEAPVRFDFMTPDDPSVEPGRKLVPYALVRATLERAMTNAMNNTRELRALYPDCRITHICTPPPFREVAQDAHLPLIFQANMHLGVSPGSVRKKLYRMHSEIARQTCRKMGVGFLGVPNGCTDEDGYLLDKYCGRDPTHANEHYGKLVLRQILGT